MQHDEQFCTHGGDIVRNFFNFDPDGGAGHEQHRLGERAERPSPFGSPNPGDVVDGPVLQFAPAAAIDNAVLEINRPVIGGRNHATIRRSRDETVANRDSHEGAFDADVDHVLHTVAAFPVRTNLAT